MKNLIFKTFVLTTIAITTLFSACKRNADVAPFGNDVEVNNWITEQMKYWYFWNDKIPATPNTNQTPDKFFDSILYKFDAAARPDGDRFSWIQESADQLQASLAGESKSTGAEFQLYRRNNTDDLGGRILYVLPNTPAAQAGLKRGDLFINATIDGEVMTGSNYSKLLNNGTTYKFAMARYENAAFVANGETKQTTAQVIQEDPLFLDSVYVRGNSRIAYLVYNQFVHAPNGAKDPLYNQKMDRIFAKFKAANVNELVLDLRYNSGGTSTASTNLASLIAKGASSSKVFVKREWNATASPALEKQYGKNFFFDYFTDKTENIGNNLSRVFILTSTRSASASELVINGLKPYMNVFLIGDKTVGKNVGSITLRDDKKRHNWGLQPIVAKNFNSEGKSDFTAGFQPNVEVKELLAQPIQTLGDTRDLLLNEAFFQITGTRTMRRGIAEPDATDRNQVFSTIERKAGGGNYFIDLPVLGRGY